MVFRRFVGKRRVASPFDAGPPRGRLMTARLMTTRKTLLVLFCLFVFFVCPLLYGQATGSFSGTVTDKTGSVVSGASVKATVQGTGIARESKTDDSGHYLMPLLPVGDYTVRVDSQGFGPVEQKDVRLQVDEH